MRTQKLSVFIVTTKGNGSWGLIKNSTDVFVSWWVEKIKIWRLLGFMVELQSFLFWLLQRRSLRVWGLHGVQLMKLLDG